jgi:hypothetical protein
MKTTSLAIAMACACGASPQLPAPDASTDHTVALEMTPFMLDPGKEVTKCQWFANPLGADLEIREFESHQSIGTHHMFLTTSTMPADPPDGPLADCASGVTADDIILYGAQVPDYRLSYPSGVAVVAPQHQGLRMQVHYLNATDAAVMVSAQIVLHLAEPGTVTQHAGVVIFANQSFTIPPGTAPTTITHTCTAPADMNVVVASGHMHHHGTDLVASRAGVTLYETTTWSEPPSTVFDPPLALHAGDPITFSCTYQNDTGAPITFGPSAATNEMCNFSTRVYPVPALPYGSFACI